VYLDLHLINKPEFFSNAFSPAYDAAGDLVDAELAKKLADLLQALVDWALVLKKGRDGRPLP
ncbi:MAG: hypothetical protein K2G99_00565, partial [Desulfovibrio sp.]|nr:hypothetical protein [Desulfovibrio sp.]